jgi:GTPase SAR1 family protein
MDAQLQDRCVLVLGMPGVGKSLLVTQLRSASRRQPLAAAPTPCRVHYRHRESRDAALSDCV